MTEYKVDGVKTELKNHVDVLDYSHLTVGFMEHLIEENPLANARKLARAYQNSIRMYEQLDQEKVNVWKTIRNRLERAYRNREENVQIQAFTPSWVRQQLGVQAPEAYHADIGENDSSSSDNGKEREKLWWHDCGIKVTNLEAKVRKDLFPFLQKKEEDLDKEADELADEIKIQGWDPESRFVTFGRKVLLLEMSVKVFAEELRKYVLYGGGDKFGVDGGVRDYEWIRTRIGTDAYGGTITVDETEMLVKAPPPSPFLVEFQRIPDYSTQMSHLLTITKDLHKSHEGRKFLQMMVEDLAAWEVDPQVESHHTFFHEAGGTLPRNSIVDNNAGKESAVRALDKLLSRHMGFSLLAFLDNPNRDNSRAAEPGTQQPPHPYTMFQWYYYNPSTKRFVKPSDRRGAVMAWKNRQSSSDRCPLKENTWELRDSQKGRQLGAIAQRALKGSGQQLGTNCKIPKDHPPSADFSDTELATTHVETNIATSAGVVMNLTNVSKTAQTTYSGFTNLIDYMEHMTEQDKDLSVILKAWKDTVSPLNNALMSSMLAASYGLLKIMDAAKSGGSIEPKEWNSIVGTTFDGIALINDFSDNKLKQWLDDLVSFRVTEQMVDLGIEIVGSVVDLIDATYQARDAAYALDHGRYFKGATMAGVAVLGFAGGVTSLLISAASGTSIAGIAVPHLYIVSALCAVGALVLTIVTAAAFDYWSDLERWVRHCYFGNQYGFNSGQDDPYYGFKNTSGHDFGRQMSAWQGEQYANSVDDCWVAREAEDHPFKLKISGLQGLSEASDIVVCALPDEVKLSNYQGMLFPLLYFDMSWNRRDLETEDMPTGFTFGTIDTFQIETFEVRNNRSGPGKTFELDCSNGSNANNVKLFRNHFLSPPARSDWTKKKGKPIKDWGWEVLYFPSGMPPKQRNQLKQVDNTDSGSRAFQQQLFSLSVPRLRLQMAKQSNGTFAFDNQWLTGNQQ